MSVSWSVEAPDPKLDRRYFFIVRDARGQALAYVYFEEGRAAAKLLTRDEARRIAPNIAKLPPAINKTAPKIFDVTA